jgi:hypothetical protein
MVHRSAKSAGITSNKMGLNAVSKSQKCISPENFHRIWLKVSTLSCVRELIVIGPWAVCVRQVGPFVWGEAQSLAYKYVHLFLDLIEQL